ncbi:hypothetical protein RclHR1_00090032 [Rhizophagus clarus]|uniref:Serine-threonine/tyrosine-protein kinase catalytic domain-containing protein n=1 Tax=Rhizophagus clarus TaxID=94130 RepID=A0A2Z6S2H9_9GLOM|nr:hypothetical protein RclHR1_00090032 [Rhizophagus clarus]
MDSSNQNLNTTAENTIEDNSKPNAKNLWKDSGDNYQTHATIFSTDSTTDSNDTDYLLERINIMDLVKRKEVYGVCGECNEPSLSKIYTADWPKGNIDCWDIEIQKWIRLSDIKVVLKSLDNSSNISNDFLNEYGDKIEYLCWIIDGLSNIHDAEKVHKDFHSGNILFETLPFISDLGLCQPVNNEEKSGKKGVYGVIPYMTPEEVLHTPKLIADLIIKCWGAKPENRPTAKELCQILKKYSDEIKNNDGEIYSQIEELNSNDYLSSFQEPISSITANPISECLDCELNELDLNQDDYE